MDKRYEFGNDDQHEEIHDIDVLKSGSEDEKLKREKMERELKNNENMLRWGGNSGSYFCLIIGVIMFVVGCDLQKALKNRAPQYKEYLMFNYEVKS